MTAITYTIYEQPQSPVLENPTPDKAILENPKADNPTSENPTQLNKYIQNTDLSKKKKKNKDRLNTDSIPILSFPLTLLLCVSGSLYRKRKERKRKTYTKSMRKLSKTILSMNTS